MQALIIIDMQEAPMSQPNKYDCAGVTDRINCLASSVRQAAGAVIFIQHDGVTEEGLVPGSPGWEISHKLRREPTDIIIRKTTNNAFYDTQLCQYLQCNSIEQLIFCGWATDYCVDSTIKAAISLEYKIAVAADCHTLCNRGELSASQVINYFNTLWTHMISPTQPVQVKNAAQLIDTIRGYQ